MNQNITSAVSHKREAQKLGGSDGVLPTARPQWAGQRRDRDRTVGCREPELVHFAISLALSKFSSVYSVLLSLPGWVSLLRLKRTFTEGSSFRCARWPSQLGCEPFAPITVERPGGEAEARLCWKPRKSAHAQFTRHPGLESSVILQTPLEKAGGLCAICVSFSSWAPHLNYLKRNSRKSHLWV